VLNLWTCNWLRMGTCRGPKVKTYTDGYKDALLDIKIEIEDSPMTIQDVAILLDELLADLASL
jgi:hypothetical protein